MWGRRQHDKKCIKQYCDSDENYWQFKIVKVGYNGVREQNTKTSVELIYGA